jgi:hypothetical protein
MSPSTGATLRQERGGAIKKSLPPHAISLAEMLRFGCYQRSVNTKTMLNRALHTGHYFLSKRKRGGAFCRRRQPLLWHNHAKWTNI